MKRTISILLALLMLFSLAACGEQAKEEDPSAAPVDDQEDAFEFSSTDGLDDGKTETEDTIQSVSYMGDWVIQDILGDEYNDQGVAVIDSQEALQPYLQVLKEYLATVLKDMANMGERVNRLSLEAALHLRETIDTFEEYDVYLRNRKLLLIRINSSYWQGSLDIRDVVLVEQGEERKLQVNGTMKYGFGSDVTTYMTLWVIVPDDLNIDYENDVEIDLIKY